MKTKILEIDNINGKSLGQIKKAAEILRKGGLVAFPTETVYGLGADAFNPQAVEGIYRAKGRPSDNPLIVHIADIAALGMLTPEASNDVKILAEEFWPGPLTMVLPKTAGVPHITTGGLETVAVRMPDNRIALELIKQSELPIAAPSANISGRPSPTKGEHVVKDLIGKIDAIIIGDDCKVGIESTVLDMTKTTPTILRPGIITPEQLSDVLGKKVIFENSDITSDITVDFKPSSPGMKYTHYSPVAEMIIFDGAAEDVDFEINRIKQEKEESGCKVGLVEFSGRSYEDAARDFFAKLRELDNDGVDLIIARAVSSADSVGFALMNRMLKAADYKVRRV